jgi:predicted DNA-binding transcriptional regulator AlpA
MNNDKFIKRKEVLKYLPVGDTKLKELISSNKFVKAVKIDGYNEGLFSLNEIQAWIEEQKNKRKV